MREQCFLDWLAREVASCRMALVGLYEQKDKLLFVEAPPLRKRYMEAIGIYEETVLEAELEVALLRRKVEMIQIAVNRREFINMQAIDAALAAEKDQKVAALEASDRTLYELPQLNEQEMHTLQRQYREITSNFHPAMNPDSTDTQKELYEKAQKAYQMQDVAEMKLIYDMLFSPEIDDDRSVTTTECYSVSTAEVRRESFRNFAAELSTDYKLAKQLYSCFLPLEEDAVFRDSLEHYNAQRKALEEEIAAIRDGFPFNAVPTLNDKYKTGAYLAELRVRARQCETEKAQLEHRIITLTEGAANG